MKEADYKKILSLYKAAGSPEEYKKRLLEEARLPGGEHEIIDNTSEGFSKTPGEGVLHISMMEDLATQGLKTNYYYKQLKTIDELLERDKRREKDGFPRKIRLGRIIKPGKGGADKIIVVPTTVEEKFYHDRIRYKSEDPYQDKADSEGGQPSGGTGEGEEGDVIGEVPIHQDGEGEGRGTAGEGGGEGHDITSNAYDIGKILTEKFKLPNLKEKGKKKSFTKYTYDLTDRNRGFGQILDKKATLKRILQTNIALGRLPDPANIDTTGFLIDPRDNVYRVLSKEKDYESQALVFFIRDYSGSMYGKPTEIVTTQHLMIYSWLSYQYENQVETRFILHDNEAKEVPDFYTYYNLSIAGGTFIASAYRLVNEIVKNDNLAKDYNIYIFHGTDGDDLDNTGQEALEEARIMLTYANRIGITLVRRSWGGMRKTAVEQYFENSQLLTEYKELIRLSTLPEEASEENIVNGIKDLIEETV